MGLICLLFNSPSLFANGRFQQQSNLKILMNYNTIKAIHTLIEISVPFKPPFAIILLTYQRSSPIHHTCPNSTRKKKCFTRPTAPPPGKTSVFEESVVYGQRISVWVVWTALFTRAKFPVVGVLLNWNIRTTK